jgi:DNA mismatch repair protein MutS
MLHVDDLRIEAEVLPLFNYTYSMEAEAALLQLLQNLPPTVEGVLEKQHILRAFVANQTVLADFSYPKLQLQEVSRFLQEVVSGRLPLETNRLQMAVRLLFSEEVRYQSRARYVQVLLFFRRLEQNYFSRLHMSDFPAVFKAQLTQITRFLERFSLADSAHAIAEDQFSAALMVRFARQLMAVHPEDLAAFWQAFFQFEAYWSAAKGMQQLGLVLPEFQAAGLQLTDFYHPLLSAPVRNTLQLHPTENVVVLTGPNMSGKSTLLKAVGLCVYLAHAGLGVPAAACRLPFYRSIVVTIDLSDSLASGYSHFMAEIQHLKAVLHAAHGPGQVFAIFDELFRGTNVDDALEITRATLRGLAGFPGSCFLISTHLQQLKGALAGQPGLLAYCIECTLHDGKPVFSYRLQAGWSTLKIGQILFAKEGLHELLRPPAAGAVSAAMLT